jgi:hypothetical protein
MRSPAPAGVTTSVHGAAGGLPPCGERRSDVPGARENGMQAPESLGQLLGEEYRVAMEVLGIIAGD